MDEGNGIILAKMITQDVIARAYVSGRVEDLELTLASDFLPLYAASAGQDQTLVLSDTGRVACREILSSLIWGCYMVEVFDTIVEARAAAASLSATGVFLSVEVATSERAEGIVLARRDGAPASGATGEPQVAVGDRRRPSAWRRPIRCSTDFTRRACIDRLTDPSPHAACSWSRGVLLAELFQNAISSYAEVPHLQAKIACMPGADIPVKSMSVGQVQDSIEDIMEDMDAALTMPTERIISEHIRRATAETDTTMPDLIYKIAWGLIRSNMVEVG